MTNTSLHMNLLNQLLGRVLRSADPTLLLLLSRWSDSWKKARINKAETDANVQLIEDVVNAKSQLIKDVTKSMSQMIIKAQADELKTDSSAIESDSVSDMIEFQIEKKMTKLVASVKHAVKELEGLLDIPDPDPDPAWTNRWVDGAQNVDSEELQRLWGKILAGQIKSPGQTSLRTLSILRDMTQKEAQDFLNLMHYRIWTFILKKEVLKVLGERSINLITHFSDIGLLRGFGVSPNLIIQDDGTLTHEHCGYILRIAGQPGQQLDTVLTPYNTSLITAAGLELAQLCQHQEPDITYLSHFARLLAEQNCKLLIRKVENREGKKIQRDDIRIIEPFVEPEEHNQEEPSNAE